MDQPQCWLRISQPWLFLGQLYWKPVLHLEFKDSPCFTYGLEDTCGPQAAFFATHNFGPHFKEPVKKINVLSQNKIQHFKKMLSK
jgi:hypothetical protein